MPSNFYLNRNVPQEAHEVMGDLVAAGRELRWVAFAPGGGDRFSIVTDKTFFNRNIPRECHDQMVAFVEAGRQIRCVAFPAEGGNRFSIVTDQTFFNRNIPAQCHDHMVALRDDDHDIVAVAFPPQGGNRYSIITDRGFVNRNVPNELHERMGLFLRARAPFRCVAFETAGNGWSLLAGGPSAQPVDNDALLTFNGSSQMTNSDVPALTGVTFSAPGQRHNLSSRSLDAF